MHIPPTIACSTCIVAANNGGRAVDMSCTDCCIRHIEAVIEQFRTFGGDAHVEAVKDGLVEKWVREA